MAALPHLPRLLAAELERFERTHPRSRELARQARAHLVDGVPMPWMVRAPGSFPLFLDSACGARFTDVDGHTYVDLCLGDTAAMAGHAPPAVVAAVAHRMARGATLMLPSEDGAWVAAELARRFGLPAWQFATTATDANRVMIRLARHLTGRPKILVFHWCYHGTVDETFAGLDAAGRVAARPGNLGPPVPLAETTRVVEWNDVAALERELAHGDVACVLAEPALTNIGIVLPEPGFHAALRELTRRSGTLLVLDETHTFCAGPGGATRAWDLAPDALTIGKAIAGGFPAAAYGLSAELAARLAGKIHPDESDTGGIGGTLAGNALALAAMRATLEHALTDDVFPAMAARAERFATGVEAVITKHDLPWSLKRLGARAEYWFRRESPRNGAEAAAAVDFELDRYLHLAALNRGVLMTPFHNMALMCPETTDADVDHHTAAFAEAVGELVG